MKKPSHVIGPVGELLAFDDLPLPNERRWTARRKAEVVAAIRGGLVTFDEACSRYSLTLDELIGWHGAFDRSGVAGLRITQQQFYRDRHQRRGF